MKKFKEKTLYQTLQVTEDASPEVIKAAYLSLIKKYHPDSNPAYKQQATQMSSELNYAYSILSDPLKRQQYDSTLKKPLRLSLKRPHKYMIFVISVGVLIIIFMQTNFFKNKVSSSDSENSNILIDGNTFASKVDTSLLDFALKNDPLTAQLRENELSELMPSFSYDELKYMVWASKESADYHLITSCPDTKELYLVTIPVAEAAGCIPCSECFELDQWDDTSIFASEYENNEFLQLHRRYALLRDKPIDVSYSALKDMVWISETGLCYHLDPTCYGLSNDSVLISLDDAQKSGYLRCGLCFKK